jgi:hypothetical protein
MLIFMTTTSKPTSDQFRIDDLAGICGMIITPEIRAMTRRAPSTTAQWIDTHSRSCNAQGGGGRRPLCHRERPTRTVTCSGR